MAEARVRLGFRNATDARIVAMADAVVAGMTNNGLFEQSMMCCRMRRRAADHFVGIHEGVFPRASAHAEKLASIS